MPPPGTSSGHNFDDTTTMTLQDTPNGLYDMVLLVYEALSY